jgi:hypothetical protein
MRTASVVPAARPAARRVSWVSNDAQNGGVLSWASTGLTEKHLAGGQLVLRRTLQHRTVVFEAREPYCHLRYNSEHDRAKASVECGWGFMIDGVKSSGKAYSNDVRQNEKHRTHDSSGWRRREGLRLTGRVLSCYRGKVCYRAVFRCLHPDFECI